MAAGLAHEIRNPLGAIKGAVQVVEPCMHQFDAHTREFLGVIVEEVERLNRVVSQFLAYSRPFKGEMSRVDVRTVVDATLRLLPDEHRSRIVVEPEHGPVSGVRGDADALRQVIHNLVLNALDAISGMDPPGRVSIAIEERARALPTGDAVAISVSDNGPGLSAETMTNLFVPFHTTKSGGTGLGLPISQRIVENHHGIIQVSNVTDGGARFAVVLPLEPDVPSPVHDRSPSSPASAPSTAEDSTSNETTAST
jgi:signal transduction histidine kinase